VLFDSVNLLASAVAAYGNVHICLDFLGWKFEFLPENEAPKTAIECSRMDH
jgi:hypothetical protein